MTRRMLSLTASLTTSCAPLNAHHSELVFKFSATEPRFEAPGDDPLLFKGAADALKELAAGLPLELPATEWPQEQVKG